MKTAKPTTAPQPSQPSTPQNAPKGVAADALVNIEMPQITGAPPANTAGAALAKSEPIAENEASAPLPAGLPECDKRGVRYDPQRHLPKIHPLTKCWMPRKQRKTSQRTGAEASAAPIPAPKSYIPRETPAPEGATDTAKADGEAASGAAHAMPAASAQAVAEVATNAGYALTGALIGDPKAARPSPAEHANLRDTAAAYVEARGLKFVGGLAVFVGICAYLLGEDRRDMIFAGVKNFVAKLRKQPLKTAAPAEPAATAATEPNIFHP